MKIAICISGFIRTWEHTKMSFIHTLCKGVTPDIFIHTYNQNYFQYSAGKEDIIYTDDEIREMFADFNVKAIKIENRDNILPELIEQNGKFSNCWMNNQFIPESSCKTSQQVNSGLRILDQVRKIEESFELKNKYEIENNFKYDIVVKTRFDILYLSSPKWDIITDSNIFTEVGGTGGYPHDQVTFGTGKDMDLYSKRYSRIDEIINVHNSDMCAHDTFRVICNINNINITPGIIYSVLLRNENEFHKLWEGTVHISTLTDISLKQLLIKNMFPNKILYENDNLDIETTDDSIIFCITSMIHLTNDMSTNSSEDRLQQTLETIKSIKEKVPKALIILLEGSNISSYEISKLYPNVNKIMLFESEESKCYFNTKSYGEVYKLLTISKKLENIPFNKVFKISGRYYLNDNFNIDNFGSDITGNIIKDEYLLNILYSVDKNIFIHYKNLFTHLINNNITYDIEHYLFLSDLKINTIEKLGVSGICEW